MPSFDFQAEVARIRQDFAGETQNITFVDMATPNAEERVREWVEREAHPEDDLKQTMSDVLTGYTRAVLSYTTNAKLVLLERDYTVRHNISSDKSSYFMLYHELGHCIVPNALPWKETHSTEETAAMERRADIFATLYGIRNNILNEEDIVDILQSRLLGALALDINHLTSESLEIVGLALEEINIRDLAPATLCRASDNLARQAHRPEVDFQEFIETLRAATKEHQAELLSVLNNVRKNGLPYAEAFEHEPLLCQRMKEHFQTAAATKPPRSLENYVAQRLSLMFPSREHGQVA